MLRCMSLFMALFVGAVLQLFGSNRRVSGHGWRKVKPTRLIHERHWLCAAALVLMGVLESTAS